MSKQDYRKARKKAYELPRLDVGDVLLVGKFKNRKATITGFSSDENNQPVAQTDKGDQKIFKPRIAKLMPAKQRLMAYGGWGGPASRAAGPALGLGSSGRSKRQHEFLGEFLHQTRNRFGISRNHDLRYTGAADRAVMLPRFT